MNDDTRELPRQNEFYGADDDTEHNENTSDDETSLEQRTMGRFSEREAEKIFAAKPTSVQSALKEYSKKILEIDRRATYFSASANRDGISENNVSDSSGSIRKQSIQPSSSSSVNLGKRDASYVVRPEDDVVVTSVATLLDSELEDPTQKYIHINLASRYVPPRSAEPAIRLCGAWSNSDDLRARINFFATQDDRPTHLCWPAHSFRLMASSIERLMDDNYVKQKKHAILQAYHENRSISTQNFLKKTGNLANLQSITTDAASDGLRDSNSSVVTEETLQRRQQRRYKSSRMRKFEKEQRKGLADGRTLDVAYPDNCRLSDQRFAAVIFIPDYVTTSKHEDPEPLFMFLRAFSTLAACEAYAERIAHAHYSEYNIDVVDLYEWLWPTQVRSKDLKEQYRNSELAQIIDQAKIEKNTVLSYAEWCKLKNVKANTIDIGVPK